MSERKGGIVRIAQSACVKIIIHATRFANAKIPNTVWKDVHGILIGTFDGGDVIIEDAIPLQLPVHDSDVDDIYDEEVKLEIAKIEGRIGEKGQAIVGWYHSRPLLGFFLSFIDALNHQNFFHKRNPMAVALIFDSFHSKITASSEHGFKIFRLNKTFRELDIKDEPDYDEVGYEINYWDQRAFQDTLTLLVKGEFGEAQRKLDRRILAFVSYATKDANQFQVARIAEALTRYPEIDDVLYWEEDMQDDIYQYMNKNVGRCDVFLMFCSQNALHSKPVEMEWMTALKLEKKIIPIFLNETDIPPLLTTKLGVLYRDKEFEGTLEDIHQLILKKVQTPASRSIKSFFQEYFSLSSVKCIYCKSYLTKLDFIARWCPFCGGLIKDEHTQ